MLLIDLPDDHLRSICYFLNFDDILILALTTKKFSKLKKYITHIKLDKGLKRTKKSIIRQFYTFTKNFFNFYFNFYSTKLELEQYIDYTGAQHISKIIENTNYIESLTLTDKIHMNELECISDKLKKHKL